MKSTTILKNLLPALILLVSSNICSAGAIAPDLASKLQSSSNEELVDVIVQFAERTYLTPFHHRTDRRSAHADLVRRLKSTAQNSQGPLKKFLRKQGFKNRELWIRNAVATQVPAATVATLSAWPGVVEVLLDAEVPQPSPQPLAAPTRPPTWNLQAIGAPEAWASGYTGAGAIVAVIDSGVDLQHSDLVNNWKGNPGGWFNPLATDCGDNCTSCDSETTTPCDFLDGFDLAHGTSVASLITGRDADTSSIGVAPDAQWIAAKIFGEGIASTNSHIIQAFQWALDPTGDPADVPNVVNNSWGFENNPDECLSIFQNEIRVLQAAGIHVVFAGGNAGPGDATSVSPANLPEGLAVGSVGQSLVISAQSSRGPSACSGSIYTDLSTDVYPEVVAPGDGVLVANMPDTYAIVSGTSFSAPHVSGALALLSGSQNTSRQQIEEALLATASDLGATGADNTYGRGIINVPAAIEALSLPPNPVLFQPADGSIDVEPLTTFSWYQGPDPNGDPLSFTLHLSKNSDFSNEQLIPVALSLSTGSLLLAGLVLVPFGRRRTLLSATLLLALATSLIYACGSDSGGSGSPALTPNHTFTLNEADTLEPQTLYYWKIETRDSDGNIVESPSHSFTTR